MAFTLICIGMSFSSFAQSQENSPCLAIQSVSWEHTSDCGAADGKITITLVDAGADATTYSVDLNFGSKTKTFENFRALDGKIMLNALYPGDYSNIVLRRDSDGCASAPYERTILIDHGCDLGNDSRANCGTGLYSPNYYNCEGEYLNIYRQDLTPGTYIYTDNDYLACGIAYVDGCVVQPSVRAYCLDYNKTEPTPAAGYPYGTAHFTRVVGAANAGYTNELAMERINWVLCNAPNSTLDNRVAINQAIWYFTGTTSSPNSLVSAAASAVSSIQGGIANQMIFYLPESSTVQPFVEAVCITSCSPDLTITNTGDCTLEIFWDNNGTEVSYGAITSGNSITVSTYEDHVWRIRTLDGTLVDSYTVVGCQDQSLNVATNDCHGACNGNILTNPGFESGLTGWTTSGTNVATTTTATNVFTGNAALLLDDPNSSVSQNFSLNTLETFTLTLWAREDGSSGTYSFGVQYLNNFGTVISTSSQTVSGATYTEYSLSGLAPIGTRSARVFLSRNSSTNANAYFDEVCLTVSEAATPTSTAGDWDFDCDSSSSVETIAVGADCQAITSINIPNTGTVFQYVVEIVYKGGNPGPNILFSDASGTSYSLSRTSPVTGSSDVFVYRGLVDGSTSSISYTDLLGSCSLDAITVYAFHNTGGDGIATSGTFTGVSGYRSSSSFSISIPDDFTTRNVTVRVPLTNLTDDCRLVNITAEAGGVSNTVTISGPDAGYGSCCLAIPEVTLNNVPATATQVTITVESPSGTSTSCPVSASQDGQNFVVAGYVTVETDCGDCTTFSPGSISGEEEACGSYDPGIITGSDIAGGGASCPATGTILLERYDNISGVAISDLTSDPDYPDNPDYSTELTSLFESPTDIGDSYGQRLSAYLCPPTTGNYIFWIAGDDNSELNLSSDDNPANATTIASVPDWTSSRQWDKFSSQQSASIYLEAGQVYYIEALMKEGGGLDNLAVGWQLPGGSLERPIPASYFSAPSDASIEVDYQWQYRLGTSGSWIDISGATGVDYNPGTISQTTQYRREVSNDFCGAVYSNEVTKRVSVEPDVTVQAQDGSCTDPNGGFTFTFAGVTGQTAIEFSLDGGNNYTYNVDDEAGTFSITDLAPGSYDIWTRWGNGDCPVDLGTQTIGFDDSDCDDDFSTPFYNDCGSGRIIDVQMNGLLNSVDNCVNIGNTGGMTRVIAEVWIQRSNCADNTFPDFITITADGATSQNVTGVAVAQASAGSVPERIYRAEFTGTVSSICLSNLSDCAAASIALYIERNAEGGSSAFTPIDYELYDNSTPAGADDCVTTTLDIGGSDAPRDVEIKVPVHEKDDTREVQIAVSIENDGGTVVASGSQVFTAQNAGPEGGLYTLTIPDVPGDGTIVIVEVCSPDPDGDSFGIGALVTSSTESCVTCDLAVTLESVETCAGEIVTLSPVVTGGTTPYTYAWSGGETTASIEFTANSSATYAVTVTDARGCEVVSEINVDVRTASIDQIVIYDLDSGSVFDILEDGDSYIIADLPTNYNIEAIVSGDVGSVRFTISGPVTDDHIENSPPYRYNGDNVAIDLSEGTYTLTVETFSEDAAAGLLCAVSELTFTIEACTVVAEAGADQFLCECETPTESSSGSTNPIGSIAGNFNAFVENGATFRGGDSDGAVAIGGDLTLDGNFVFAGQTAGSLTDVGDTRPSALVVEGSVNYTSGSEFYINNSGYAKIGDLSGSTVFAQDQNGATVNTQIVASAGGYNSSPRIQVQTQQPASSVSRSGLINFTSAFSDFRTMSDAMSALDNTVANPASIDLTAGTTNVLNVSGATLSGLSTITFNNQPNATTPLIINVNAGGTFNWNLPTLAGIGSSQGKYIIWNFYNTANLTINGGQTLIGSLLVPNGSLTKANSGNIDGQVVAATYVHERGEIHNQPFAAEVTVSTATSECADAGRAVTLTASGGESFLWSTGETTASISVSPLVTTTYTVTVTTGNCSDTDAVTVHVNPTPTADAGSDQEICLGESVDLTASGGGNYTWSTGETQANITVAPTSTTTYYVTVTNGENCSGIDEVTVVVNQPPVVSFDAGPAICSGETVTLTPIVSGGSPEYTYSWASGENTSAISISPNETTTYTVTVTDNKGCSASASVTVTVDPNLCASLGDLVWEDLDGDGLQDAGEPGVEGVTVNLKDETATVIATTTTAADGSYSFTGLPPGDYAVQFTDLPADFFFTDLNAGSDETLDSDADPDMDGMTELVTLAQGDNYTDLDAGILTGASLGDYVWEDLNGDGIQDAGEPGVSGITVTLLDGDGVTVGNTFTAADGSYSFTDLEPGDYSVVFSDLPVDYNFTDQDAGGNDALDSDANPADGSTATVTLESGDNYTDLDAGILTGASLGDYVWEDLNGDGIQDAGEPGVGGVTVTLLDGDGATVGTTTTAVDGSYSFTDLEPGDYSVVFSDLPMGYNFTDQDAGGNDALDSDANSADGSTATVTLESGDNYTDLDAGILTGASLGDYVWEDLNGDGIQDAGEPGVGGVTVTLLDGDGATVGTTTTAADGSYSFTNLEPGDYSVVFSDLSVGYNFTDQDAGGDDALDSDANPVDGSTATVTLESGDNYTDLDAGILTGSSIGDYVWEDLNGDGIQDAGEPGVGGVTVTLLDGDGATVGTTTTAADGSYSFTDLEPGDYSVVFSDLPMGYNFTDQDAGGDDALDSDANPADGSTATVTLESGDNYTDLDAGILTVASLGDYVWEDLNGDGIQDASEPGVSGVTVTLLDGDGATVGTTTTATDGSYSFTDLEPGDYSVVFSDLPMGYNFTDQDAGGDDALDSDANSVDGSTATVTLESGDNYTDLDAGILTGASLGDYVWEDLNGDGIQDADEPGVSGVTVTLLDGDGATVGTTTTAADGSYSFTDLEPGNYSVVFSNLPVGYNFTDQDAGGDDALDSDANPADGSTATVTLESGDNYTDLDAGILTGSSIGDYVWEDLNGDGIQDAGEPGVSGVTVTLLDGDGATVGTTT
ncbi:hypothetical protein CRP01_40730, partial [Flavilitoribacter nigricans DSM 23189 = NBRC 102662]